MKISDIEIKNIETNYKLKESDILEMEEKIGYKFPESYKKYMLQYNGGLLEGSYGFEMENVIGFVCEEELTIMHIMKFGPGEDSSSLYSFLRSLKMYNGRIPKPYIPFASGLGGKYVFYLGEGENYGKVYFWENEYELFFEDEPEKNCVFIADSFDALWDKLEKLD